VTPIEVIHNTKPPKVNYLPEYISVDDSDLEFSAFCDSIIRKLEDMEFDANNTKLHSPDSIRFYSQILKASDKVINTLTYGHKPQWLGNSPPGPMFLRNNASARQNMDIVRNQVKAWEEMGAVKQVLTRPRIVNPLTLSTKIDTQSGKPKYRVCMDLSRTLNLYVKETNVVMEDLSAVLPRFDFIFVLFLGSMKKGGDRARRAA
jgi:hypothetical protein